MLLSTIGDLVVSNERCHSTVFHACRLDNNKHTQVNKSEVTSTYLFPHPEIRADHFDCALEWPALPKPSIADSY